MEQVAVVGVIGSYEAISLLLSRLTGLRLTQSNILPPGINPPWEDTKASSGSLRYALDAASRTLYVLLDTPAAPADLWAARQGAAGDIREQAMDAKAKFMRGALLLILSTHMIIWLQPSGRCTTALLQQLYKLQKAKELACKEEGFHSPAWARGEQSAANVGGGHAKPAVPPLLLLGFQTDATGPHAALLAASLELQVRAAFEQVGLLGGKGLPPLFKLGLEGRPAVFVTPTPEAYFQAVGTASLAMLSSKEHPASLPALAGSVEVGKVRDSLVAHLATLLKPPPGLSSVESLPSLEAWCEESRVMASQVMGEGADASSAQRRHAGRPAASEGGLVAAASLLHASVDPCGNYSRALCESALRSAVVAYMEKLPPKYPAGLHASAQQRALRAFAASARGPKAALYAAKVAQACEGEWQAGRQLCSAVSLTGHPCTLAPHDTCQPVESEARLPAEDAAAEPTALKQAAAHSSGVSYLLADASGCTRRLRPDFFDLASANGPPASSSEQGSEQSRVLASQPLQLQVSRVASGDAVPLGPWAHASIIQPPNALNGDVGSWVEGFKAGASHLHALNLPRPAGPSAVPREQETAPEPAAVDSITQGIQDLDLEFPPLLSAAAPALRDSSNLAAAKLTAEMEEHDAAERYREEIRSGWPGQAWADLHSSSTAPNETAAGRRRGRGRRGGGRGSRGRAPIGPGAAGEQERVLLGFEYESLQGIRFFLAPEHLPAKGAQERIHSSFTWLMTHDLPVWMDIPAQVRRGLGKSGPWDQQGSGESKAAKAQLRRIWISTPGASLPFQTRPVIRMQVGREELEFSLRLPHGLPPSSLSVICLPLIYGAPLAWLGGLQRPDAVGPEAGDQSNNLGGTQEDENSRVFPLAGGKRLNAWLVAGSALSPK